jgi:hypothetical protein
VIVEDRLPDPALARQGQLVDEPFSMLAVAAGVLAGYGLAEIGKVIPKRCCLAGRIGG